LSPTQYIRRQDLVMFLDMFLLIKIGMCKRRQAAGDSVRPKFISSISSRGNSSKNPLGLSSFAGRESRDIGQTDLQFLFCPGNADEHQAAFFFDFVGCSRLRSWGRSPLPRPQDRRRNSRPFDECKVISVTRSFSICHRLCH